MFHIYFIISLSSFLFLTATHRHWPDRNENVRKDTENKWDMQVSMCNYRLLPIVYGSIHPFSPSFIAIQLRRFKHFAGLLLQLPVPPIGAAPDCYLDKSGQHLHQKQARTPAYPDIAKEFNDSFFWRAAIATFALNEASNLRCRPIILKILLAKVLLFLRFCKAFWILGGLFL